MVSSKVEILTLSYKEGAKAVRWSCDGTPAFEIDDAEKTDRGTDVILHIADDCKEYLEKQKIEELLNKYCKFMVVPVVFGKKQEWKDGKMQDTDKDKGTLTIRDHGIGMTADETDKYINQIAF